MCYCNDQLIYQGGTTMSQPRTHSADDNAELAEPWRQLWNGDLSITNDLIVAHAAPITGTGPDEIHGREALNQWVGGINALLPDLNFDITVGPIATDDHLVVRWAARGTYGGGFPGASEDAIGSVITFTGTDTLRVVDGTLAEYWACSNLACRKSPAPATETPFAGGAHPFQTPCPPWRCNLGDVTLVTRRAPNKDKDARHEYSTKRGVPAHSQRAGTPRAALLHLMRSLLANSRRQLIPAPTRTQVTASRATTDAQFDPQLSAMLDRRQTNSGARHGKATEAIATGRLS
jgi:hypothetical protein